MKIVIDEAIEMIERQVKSYSTCTRVSVPKSWANKRIKIILIKE
jgi:putative transposon-encoded protein